MILEINTPEKNFIKADVEMVTLPGIDGNFTVLKNHAALITELCEGKIRFKDATKIIAFFVSKGFAIIRNNHIVLNVESVNIDIETE
jgi:F-type H+-transporting ATPase subunit epsilon